MPDQAETLREFIKTLDAASTPPNFLGFLEVAPAPGSREDFTMYRLKLEEGRPF